MLVNQSWLVMGVIFFFSSPLIYFRSRKKISNRLSACFNPLNKLHRVHISTSRTCSETNRSLNIPSDQTNPIKKAVIKTLVDRGEIVLLSKKFR